MKLTKEYLESLIVSVEYSDDKNFGDLGTVTLCMLKMKNGSVVVGKSSCIDPKNFDREIGRKVAYDDAFDQLWEFEGYIAKEKLYQETCENPEKDGTDIKHKSFQQIGEDGTICILELVNGFRVTTYVNKVYEREEYPLAPADLAFIKLSSLTTYHKATLKMEKAEG